MRRIISVLAVVAVMAALLVASAMPVFALPSEEANCLAEQQAPAATTNGQELGRGTGQTSRENPGLLGQALQTFVPSDCYTR